MLIRAPQYKSLAIKSGRADCVLYHRLRLGQRLDQSTREASNESTKVGEGGRLKAGS
jgi:hypothetical protein